MDLTSSYLSSKQEQRMRLQKYFTSVCSSLPSNPHSTSFGQSKQKSALTFSHCWKNLANNALLRAQMNVSSKINIVPLCKKKDITCFTLSLLFHTSEYSSFVASL